MANSQFKVWAHFYTSQKLNESICYIYLVSISKTSESFRSWLKRCSKSVKNCHIDMVARCPPIGGHVLLFSSRTPKMGLCSLFHSWMWQPYHIEGQNVNLFYGLRFSRDYRRAALRAGWPWLF
jgi:hypothetical protein